MKARLQKKLEEVSVKRKSRSSDSEADRESKKLKKGRKSEKKPNKKEKRPVSTVSENADSVLVQENVVVASEETRTDIQFGTLKFQDDDALIHKKIGKGIQQRLKKKQTKKDLLRKLERFESKVSSMDEEKKDRVLKQKALKSALSRAQGIKVRDDMALIRKSIKRDESKKKRSSKQWEERIKKQNEDKEASKTAKKSKRGKSSNDKSSKYVGAKSA